ncbi:MAG: metalloregulator ArsR/SmtB family transcription factor, partial [Candidatus Lokiarchaeota archaeon]|nr:metalloregulator ArsR/SmtB family transcription factor [Candidatus Lokiarchaeota archaeon]
MNKTRKLARFFSALSDETRIEILSLLSKNKELTVNEIRDYIGTSLPAISYQLRILSSADLVKYDKRGRKKFFRLADAHVRKILKDGLVHIDEGFDDENRDESPSPPYRET